MTSRSSARQFSTGTAGLALRWPWEWVAAPAVVLLALALRTYNLAADGQNPYYAAGVRSMLDSWHNFFYVSFDPSGALSIDKPPLGFWAQVGAAKLLGFHPGCSRCPRQSPGHWRWACSTCW